MPHELGRRLGKAMKQAGLTLDQIDLFEYHDVFTIYAALQLEAAGFAVRGQRLAFSGRRPKLKIAARTWRCLLTLLAPTPSFECATRMASMSAAVISLGAMSPIAAMTRPIRFPLPRW